MIVSRSKEYKSPFEKKRESEIKALSKKVEKAREEQYEQQNHLTEFTENIKEQQLVLLKSEVRLVMKI